MSLTFTFDTTRCVIAEPGCTARIGELAAKAGCRNVAFVTDRGILDLGLARAALDSLAAARIDALIIDDVVADPPQAMVLDAVARAARARVDGVVSVGGGSSLDTAKLVAVLCASDQRIEAMYGVGLVEGTRLPLFLAPTTAGTGSEVTPIAIVTTGENEKKGVVSPQLLPDAALLDADLTLGLPPAVTAATGIDAMVHAIEAFTSRHRKTVVSDTLANEALRLLGANIERACTNGRDREARGAMLIGSMLAGMAFANAPVAAVHALAYPLGGHFHVPHGLSNALVLPHVMRFNRSEAEAHYAALAPCIFPDLAQADDPVTPLIDRLEALGPRLGMEANLRAVGVSHNHLPMLAEDAMKQTRLLVNNPREMTLEAARAIYEAAL